MPPQPHAFPGRRLAFLGLGLAIVGVVVYAIQFKAHYLKTPWYLPCTATLAVLLLAVALWRARTVWRAIALVFVLLLAGGEWAFLLATRLPDYTGPVAVGRPFPAFSTTRSDGALFTDRDLRDDGPTVLVFFRGRW